MFRREKGTLRSWFFLFLFHSAKKLCTIQKPFFPVYLKVSCLYRRNPPPISLSDTSPRSRTQTWTDSCIRLHCSFEDNSRRDPFLLENCALRSTSDLLGELLVLVEVVEVVPSRAVALGRNWPGWVLEAVQLHCMCFLFCFVCLFACLLSGLSCRIKLCERFSVGGIDGFLQQ